MWWVESWGRKGEGRDMSLREIGRVSENGTFTLNWVQLHCLGI